MNRFLLVLVACFIDLVPLVAQRAVPVELRLQLGHSSPVTSVAYSPDGKLFLTGSRDHTAVLWDVATRSEIRRFEGHTEDVNAVAFCPDGVRIITGSSDKTARLWDTRTGLTIRTLRSPGSVVAIVVSRDGRYVFTSDSGTARLFEVETGEQLQEYPVNGSIASGRSLALSPDGLRLLTVVRYANGDSILVREVSTGRTVRSLPGASKNITGFAVSPDGRSALVASFSGSVQLLDLETGVELLSFPRQRWPTSAVGFSRDGQMAFIAQSRTNPDLASEAQLINLATGAVLWRLQTEGVINAVAFSPDGSSLSTAGSHFWVKEWAMGTGTASGRFEGQANPVDSVTFSSNGESIMTAGRHSKVAIWQRRSGTVAGLLEGEYEGSDYALFSPDQKTILTAHRNGVARLWDRTSRKLIKELAIRGLEWRSLVFSPGGGLIVSGGDLNYENNGFGFSTSPVANGTVQAWNLEGKGAWQFDGFKAPVNQVAYSPDAKYVAAASLSKASDDREGSEVAVVDGANGRPRARWRVPSPVIFMAFAPDSSYLLTVTVDSRVTRWNSETGSQLASFKSLSYFSAISPDGRSLLQGGDKGASLWDIKSGTLLRSFDGHKAEVDAVAFSPDGRFVLTGSQDGTTCLWDEKSARKLATLVSFKNGDWAVVDPEGRYDASNPDSSPGLYWLAEGDHILELKQLKDKYIVKGLLARIMNGQSLPSVAHIQQVLVPPTVEVVSASFPKAEILATNNGGGFGEVVAFVNRREVPQIGAPQRFDQQQRTLRLTLDLSQATLLPSGENVFQVMVKNADNTIASRVSCCEKVATPKRSQHKPRLFVLLVGASKYPQARDLNPLSWSANDALSMKRAIEVAARGVPWAAPPEVAVFASDTPNRPTKKAILGYLEGLAGRVYPEDVLVLFFAGHGAAAKTPGGDDVYYFFTEDSTGANVNDSVVALDAISSVELKALLTRKDMPLKQVMILDTCAAGALASQFAKLSEQRTISPEEALVMEVLKDRSGMHILMGSSSDGRSYEASQFAQGLLTHSLLLGLKTMNDREGIDVTNWFKEAEQRTTALAKEIGVSQSPVLSSPKGQPFPLWRFADPADRALVPVNERRPVLLPPLVQDQDDFDDLRVGPALESRLIAISRPTPRGEGFVVPRLVYVAGARDEADAVPNLVKPYIRYGKEGNGLVAVIRLRSQREIKHRGEVRVPSNNPADLAGAITQWIEKTLTGSGQ